MTKANSLLGRAAVVLAVGVVGTVGLASSASARVGVAPIGPASGNAAGVHCVVTALNSYLGTNIADDGAYGPIVAAAVSEFQVRLDLPRTGVVNAATGDHVWAIDKADGDTSCYTAVPTTH